jgi:hypothetical protein
MWLYNGREITDDDLEGHVAFVYRITNLTNNRQYIGKKILKTFRKKKIKGKTRKKKVEKESDWKTYYGSNFNLIADLDKLGHDKFNREILKLCKTRGTANYWEAKYQMMESVLESDNYYNDHIWVRVHRSHIKQ